MRPRDLVGWKLYFYQGLLPALRSLGPARADALLTGLARARACLDPLQRQGLTQALRLARAALPDAGPVAFDDLAAGVARFTARDYLLDTPDGAAALSLFDVSGGDAFDEALARGRGVVLVGGHFGAHLSAFHWFFRRGVPLRVMVQRPKHVSAALTRFFDQDAPDPQSGFFLKRGLGPADCVERLLRVRAAVRQGRAVYFAGDIPWSGPNTRAGTLMGREHQFLSVWADLSALTGAPVFHVVCTHEPGGRFGLNLEPAGVVRRGGEDAAVARFLARLESAAARRADDAVAHLIWPCYAPAEGVLMSSDLPNSTRVGVTGRPSRRAPAPFVAPAP
ncbi:MAG: hypothetical protein U0835_25295 [Isosphaeraceae bacterium]